MLPDSLGNTVTRIFEAATRDNFVLTLDALVRENRARLLAEPRLVTASGREASSFIGVEVPIIQATSVGTAGASVNASIEYRQTGVLLRMTPTVLQDQRPKKITTIIEAEVSSVDNTVGLNIPVGGQVILVPGFAVRRANTEVTTESGSSLPVQ